MKRGHSGSVTCHDGHAIGLDIGATGVRAAMLNVRYDGAEPGVTADGVAGLALGPGAVTNGAVVDGDAVTAALTKLWRTHDLGCRNVILGMSSPHTLVRGMSLPDLSPEQRAQALPFQARDVVALPMDQVVIDFAQLGPPDPDTKMVEGLLVASPREPVIAAVAAVERAGLKVVRVDLGSFAVLRAVAEQHHNVGAVIDLGAHLTTIVVHQGGVPRLVRTLTRGGDELTAALAKRLEISETEAEDAKHVTGLEGDSDVAEVLTDAVSPLLAEVRSSMNYFRSGHPGTQLEHLSLTGGAGSLPGLADAIADLIGVPCQVADTSRLLQPAAKPRHPIDDRWATAVALGSGDGSGGMNTKSMSLLLDRTNPWETRPGWGIAVDLTPGEIVNARKVSGLKRLIAAGLVLVVLLCVAATVWALLNKGAAQDEFDAAQDRTLALQAEAKQYSDITLMESTIASIDAQLAVLMADDVDFVNLMARIEARQPPGVAVSNLAVLLAQEAVVAPPPAEPAGEETDDDTETPPPPPPPTGPQVIGTLTISGNASSIDSLADFVKGLSQLSGVVEVVPTSTIETENRMEFTLTMNITDELYTHRFDAGGPPAESAEGATP